MASGAGGMVQDQRLNIHYNENSIGWKTNVSKAPRKGVLGGRTPLGDLSNSLKPSLNQASKKQNSSNFSFPEKETGASLNSLNAGKKKSASGKVQTAGRKALSDISNSGKPSLNEGSKKNYSSKLNVVAEEPIDASAIAEEQFLHNHQECIKAQARAMDLDQFLQTIGLDNDFCEHQESPMSIKVQSPSRYFELEEMAEELIIHEQSWKHKLSSGNLDSPPRCSTPRSPKHFMDHDYNFNFKLLESP